MFRFILFFICCCTLLPVAAQQVVIVYFEFDRDVLTQTARHRLDSLSRQGPYSSLSIAGHCDQYGSNEYNYDLSERRAAAVKTYLLSIGIAEEKIAVVRGFGEEQPAIDKLDETSRSANRRVVISLTRDVIATTPSANNADTTKVNRVPNAGVVKQQTKEKLVEEITDTSTRAGDRIILKNINFYGGRHVFLPTAYPALEDLLATMRAIPTLHIEIQGHICCQAGDGDGLDNDTGEPFLSYNRARAVYEYLVRRGIDKSRMRYRGFGHKYPLIEVERTEEEKTINRRVEIKIISK